MEKRFLSIWFRHLVTDWISIRRPELKDTAFVLAAAERGRMVIKSASIKALAIGIETGIVVADARAIFPALDVMDEEPDRVKKLLTALAKWCTRYAPAVAVDLPDGLILDISGCAHLWGGEEDYLRDMMSKLKNSGYNVSAAIADTIGTAWAMAHYGEGSPIVRTGEQIHALLGLPPIALRLEPNIVERMHKLGLYQIGSFIGMPRSVLRRRFGQSLLQRLGQALGEDSELLQPVQVIEPYQERLPCLEPIRTATGIEIAIRKLLESLCLRLQRESKGLRSAVLKAHRVDGQVQQISIGTSFAARNISHLFRLFELKISTIRPGLGIELFLLEAPVVEVLTLEQETLWNISQSKEHNAVLNLLDRIGVRIGMDAIRRYQPDEHHWPERSIRQISSATEKADIPWPENILRPVSLLAKPERIEVTAPVPDYPPMLFIYKKVVHKIRKADGPDRIEQEWWLHQGDHRDYYTVEDEQGSRYWLFRLGHYGAKNAEWFIHGFFA